ncbi:MAG: FKBP-type peptidyl-prolyl cis-trans isomerase [Microbacterium sp.]
MRKIPAVPAVLAVLGLAAVGLAGCSQPGSSACPRPADADTSVSDLISVSGSTDAEPEITVYTPFHTDQTVVKDVETGEGTPITTDSQLVVLDVTIVGGSTGEPLVSTAYSGSLADPVQLSRITQSVPALTDALHCAAPGTRTVVALAPGDIEAETAASWGLAEDESAVAVVDIRKVYLSRADGADVFNSASGLPSVVRAPDGRPGIIIPDAEPPTEIVVQTIKRGNGDVVTGDVPVRIHYTGVSWADKTVTDTTWDSEPVSITLDAILPGFSEALTGQTVGSQVMVVVPASDAGGEQGAGETLVFVIDILGLDEPPAEPAE